LDYFGITADPTEFALCAVKEFIKIRDEICNVDYENDEDEKAKCIADTKESLGITDTDVTSKKACCKTKVMNSPEDNTSTESTLQAE